MEYEMTGLRKEEEEEEMDSQFYGVTVDEYEALEFNHKYQSQEIENVKEMEMAARVSEMDRMYKQLMKKIEEQKNEIEARDRLIQSQLEEVRVLQELNREQAVALDQKLEYEEYLLGCIFEFENSK